MRSFFLENLPSVERARDALRRLQPGQEAPSILWAGPRDAIGYFYVLEREFEVECPAIMVDVSGRHWDRRDAVLRTLEKIRALIGGRIADDS